MGSEAPLSHIALHGFTPVRRRDHDHPTRQLHAEQEKEWTAARCHRLLRALTSRVAILKRDLALLSSVNPDDNFQSQNTGRGNKQRKRRRREQDDDLDWAQSRKRLKQTYASRFKKGGCDKSAPKTPRALSSLGGMKSLAPGEVSVPTPILARARGPYLGRPPWTAADSESDGQGARSNKRVGKPRAANDGEPRFSTSRTLREIRQSTPASRYTIYEGIYNGLDTLLRSTGNREPQKAKKGTRSLFSTCLKAVPQHIAQEEATLLAHVEETGTKCAISTRDISTEIYDDLEDFGTSGRGWKPLKYVVRAHGVQVLSKAIRDELLDMDFCCTLVTLCIHTSAAEEADILLSSLLSSRYFQRPKTLYDAAPRSVSMLLKFVEDTGRFSFQYQQLAKLISTGILPLEWLATRAFRPVWTGVMQSLSPGSINPEALVFVDKMLPLMAKAELSNINIEKSFAEAVNQTFSSVLTTLLSIVILSTVGSSNEPEASTSDYEHIATLLQSSLLQYKILDPSNDESILLHIASLIAGAQFSVSTNFEHHLPKALFSGRWEGGDSPVEVSTGYNDLVSFICSVARCCGRGASSTGFEHLEYLHLILQQFISGETGASLIQCITVDSAHSFAQQLPERKHFEYASALDTKFSDRDFRPHVEVFASPSNDSRPGFRWEEGIGEWVTATPIGRYRKKNIVRRHSLTSGDEADSPLLSSPYLGRKRQYEATAQFNRICHHYSSIPSHKSTRKGIVLVESIETDYSLGSQSDMAESDDELQVTDFENEDASESDAPVSRISFARRPSSPRPPSCLEDDDYKVHKNLIYRAPRLDKRTLSSRNDWRNSDGSSAASASPSASSSASYETQEENESQPTIGRAPRSRRRSSRSSRAWQVLNESDDELSFLSESTNDKRVFQDITNTPSARVQRACKTKESNQQKAVTGMGAITDSEDELCI